ncbi:MAG: membrane protein insertion efficiency factor YidD [Candidatus Acidiferrales bacterium]
MGHCDSSARVGGEGGVRLAGEGVAAHAAAGGERDRDVATSFNSTFAHSGGVARAVLLFGVSFYRVFLSHFFGGSCKFYPSCSVYAQEAIAKHGARRGSWLALRRLLRCRPFTKGGIDPVPDSDDAEFHLGLHTKESAR